MPRPISPSPAHRIFICARFGVGADIGCSSPATVGKSHSRATTGLWIITFVAPACILVGHSADPETRLMLDYDARIFRSVANSDGGDVNEATTFHYHQHDDV